MFFKKPPPDERRTYFRIKKHFILKYFDLGTPHTKYEASQLKNISYGGLCLITSRPFTPFSKIGIELKTPFFSEMIYLDGTVLESREKIKDVIYETRVEFNPLLPQTKEVLEKMIEHFEQEESDRHD